MKTIEMPSVADCLDKPHLLESDFEVWDKSGLNKGPVKSIIFGDGKVTIIRKWSAHLDTEMLAWVEAPCRPTVIHQASAQVTVNDPKQVSIRDGCLIFAFLTTDRLEANRVKSHTPGWPNCD